MDDLKRIVCCTSELFTRLIIHMFFTDLVDCDERHVSSLQFIEKRNKRTGKWKNNLKN